MSGRFEGERAVVVGAGVAGLGAAHVLADEGARVVVSEERTLRGTPIASELTALGAELRDGGHDLEHLDGATLVVVGPGVHPDAPVVGWAGRADSPSGERWSSARDSRRRRTSPSPARTGRRPSPG